jgi:hypothetical protein
MQNTSQHVGYFYRRHTGLGAYLKFLLFRRQFGLWKRGWGFKIRQRRDFIIRCYIQTK